MIKVREKYRTSRTEYLRICKDAEGHWGVERWREFPTKSLGVVFVGTLKDCREMVKGEHGRYLLLGDLPKDKKLILNALRTLYFMALELKSVVNSLEKAIDLKNLKK